jgi:CspA family cold shock protein
MTGAIRTVNSARGFGFIRGDDGLDYFFHRAELRGLEFEELKEGLRVRFETLMTKRGPRAAGVNEA